MNLIVCLAEQLLQKYLFFFNEVDFTKLILIKIEFEMKLSMLYVFILRVTNKY